MKSKKKAFLFPLLWLVRVFFSSSLPSVGGFKKQRKRKRVKTPKLDGDRRREEGKVIERNKRVNKMFRFGVGRKKEEKKKCSTKEKITFPQISTLEVVCQHDLEEY